MKVKERFTSRWGLINSVIGIAVGTGNIWRFPRIVAANGRGSFLIVWMIFLFLWSLPLIIAEFAIGKLTRYGPIGSFAIIMGGKFAWMGTFVTVVTAGIMFYYSVVAGWCIRYFFLASTGYLLKVSDYTANWNNFIQSGWQPILFHIIAISIAACVIRRGVVHGIEKVNRFLIPVLVGLIILSTIRAVTLPGAVQGLVFLFSPQLDSLLDYRVWLQALTQNAWDTGAGWGLILTYATYMKRKEDIPLNAALIGLGNNSISLLSAIIIFSTAFSTIPSQAAEVIQEQGPANTGLTFIWIPQLFTQMSGGTIFSTFFFLALTFAAISSLISMMELCTRVLMDMRMSRLSALATVYILTLTLGIPSALSLDFFLNQDWTWGIGLMVSGAFIAISLITYGVSQFRGQHINSTGADIQIKSWYDHLIRYIIPAQVIILLTWWFSQVIRLDPQNWWNPFAIESVGTCLFQWTLAILLSVAINNRILKRTFSG